ncbi:farnesol dehydrogenase-like isoform X1 [Agrilus planipennis]|uniref:Farnesol dehydrogenase-like isoform X1 n=1 Tax=Agrilus planipennis TaxID=224129 RepID=A0A7F5RNZ9_AGRPL|nr:farnesol dehydrogenase-like isoform X1 [Agrilus planipennis]
MDRWINKVAVVTGASAGIGASIAEKLVRNGIIVAGFARRVERVENLAKKLEDAKGKLYGLKVDITVEDDIIKAFDWIKDNLGPVHILINNAGISRSGSLISGNAQTWKEILETNVLGLCVATREAVKNMKSNNVEGHIVHINSVAGHKHVGLPHMNVYSASKYAVTALGDNLRDELRKNRLKIKVSSISPGLVITEIHEKAQLTGKEIQWIRNEPILNADDVADAVSYVLGTPPHVQIQELTITPIGERI